MNGYNKPTIAITPHFDKVTNRHWIFHGYIEAIIKAGAIPIILPLLESEEDIRSLAYCYDGYLFSGGADIHPMLFNEPTYDFCGDICDLRDYFELTLFDELAKLDKPVLGICRGIQLFNVACGGTLFQDIIIQRKLEFNIMHDQKAEHYIPVHSVDIEKNSILYSIYNKEKIMVNSLHHQAIKDVGKNLKATAISEDGLVEGVEMVGKSFFVGVQWHPERMFFKSDEQFKIFQQFVDKCKEQ